MLLLNNCSDAVASMVLRELMLSMRHRCLCGAISGAAWGGGAITLSMASAVNLSRCRRLSALRSRSFGAAMVCGETQVLTLPAQD